jgi:hypothetical protein
MRLSSARVTIALAAPAGVLAGHALGYLAGGPHAGGHAVDHSYLTVAAAGFSPLAVAALLWAAMSGTRPGSRVPVGALLAAQWALFAGQEMAEHALAGHGPAEALRSPAVWLGLGAQVLVALALALLLRVAGVTGARVLASLARLVRGATAASGWPPSTGPRSPSFLPARRPSSRGPPPVLA